MITVQQITHPHDQKALQILKKIPFIDIVCRNIMKMGYERLERGENLATMVKASKNTLPRVYNLMQKVANHIGIDVPEVYVYNDPVMNAYTYGETKPFVCLSSSVVANMDDNEIMCIMAHECGHILCKHCLYKSVVKTLEDIGSMVGMISYAMTGPMILALMYWSRRSELSADCCAVAVVGDETFQRTMLKLALGLPDVGEDPYALLHQAKEYHQFENESTWNKVQQNCRMAFYSYPQMVNRAYEIDRWKLSWLYKRLRCC